MKEEKRRSKGIRDAGRRWGCGFKQDPPAVTFKQRCTSVRAGPWEKTHPQESKASIKALGRVSLVLQSKARPQGLEGSG